MFKFKEKTKKEEKELSLIKTKINISIEDFIKYLESHLLLVVVTILILFLFHGYLLFSNSIIIDTDIFLQNPSTTYNWYQIGRFGMVFEKYILGMFNFSMYYAQIVFFIFAIAFLLTTYYVFYKISGKDFNIANLILPSVIFSSAIWAEQLMFFIQMAQIAFSCTLVSLSVLWIYKWCFDKKIEYLIIGLLSMALVFGTYQAFVAVYIMFCIFCFFLVYENEELSEDLNMFILTIKLIVTFIIGFLLYQGIAALIGTDYTYLNSSNSWKWGNPKESIRMIKEHIIQILKGEGIFYSRFFSVVLILFIMLGIYKTIKNKNLKNKVQKTLYSLCYIAMCITPFLLTIYCGLAPVKRAQIYIPIFEGLLVFFLFINANKRILKLGILLLVYVITTRQLYYLESLYYTDNLRYEHDVNFVEELELTLRENNVPQGSKLVILGHRVENFNPSCIKGDMISTQLATINRAVPPYYFWSSASVVTFLRNRGYQYNTPTQEEFEEAFKNSEDIEKLWPEEGCITKYKDCYIIKVSHDNMMAEKYLEFELEKESE